MSEKSPPPKPHPAPPHRNGEGVREGTERGKEQKTLAAAEVMERIRSRLEGLWNANYDNPAVTAALVETYQDARLLKAWLDYAASMAESMAAVATEMRSQRDAAIDEFTRQPGRTYETARHDLAKMLANDARLPAADVERALGALLGDNEIYLSPFTVQDFYEALAQVVEQVKEESQLQEEAQEE